MTCKDCVHYDMCERLPFTEDKGEECDYFKDKSRFVDLTCKVGDILWFVKNGQVCAGVIQFVEIHYDGEFYDVEPWYRIKGNEFDVLLEDVGKLIFLTEEEAEEALKECEKNA